MICNKCGSEILNNSKFCNKCGHKIEVNSSSNNIFKKKSSKIIAGIMLFLILASIGGYNYYSNLPPKNVRKDIYTTAIRYIKEFDSLKENNWKGLPDGDANELTSFLVANKKNNNPTLEENKILDGLMDLWGGYVKDSYNKASGKEVENDYDKARKELKNLLNKK